MKTESFKDHLLDQLRGLKDVECRRMFGGHGLYAGGTFFGILFEGRLYFRTTIETREHYERRGMMPFRPSARQTLKSYYEVPADVVEDSRELVQWAQRAVEANHAD